MEQRISLGRESNNDSGMTSSSTILAFLVLVTRRFFFAGLSCTTTAAVVAAFLFLVAGFSGTGATVSTTLVFLGRRPCGFHHARLSILAAAMSKTQWIDAEENSSRRGYSSRVVRIRNLLDQVALATGLYIRDRARTRCHES